MTWKHLLAIVSALGFVVVCSFSPTCAAHVEGVHQLATLVIGGVVGHAGHTITKDDK